jgi:hypothetical protein
VSKVAGGLGVKNFLDQSPKLLLVDETCPQAPRP